MSNIQIKTTQNVNISFESAGLGSRILASSLDLLIMFAYMYVVSKLFGSYIESLDNRWSQMALSSIIGIPIWFYTLASEIFFAGQTIGKKALKIRVVKIDGYRASFSDYFIRWILRVIDLWLTFFIPFVGILSIIITDTRQRIGGLASGTAVISLKNNISINSTILQDLTDTYTPTYPTVINLSDRDVQIIKNLFLPAKKKRDHKTLIKLRTKIEDIIQVKKEKNMRDDRFIATVLKDYTYYTQDMV